METTRRRLASIKACFASSPTCSTRVSLRFSRRLSSTLSSSARSSSSVAATPASIFIARSTSSAAVSNGTLPISFRYILTGSPVSMVTLESVLLRRDFDLLLELVIFGRFTSEDALSSSSGISSRTESVSSVASVSSPVTLTASLIASSAGGSISSSISSVSFKTVVLTGTSSTISITASPSSTT